MNILKLLKKGTGESERLVSMSYERFFFVEDFDKNDIYDFFCLRANRHSD